MLAIYKNIDRCIKVLERFINNPYEKLRNALNDSTDTIEKMQGEQFYSGQRSDGSEILNQLGEGYTPTTKRIKRRKGQPIDRVTLKDTGAFYKSITANVLNDELQITAKDKKIDGLKAKYDQNDKLFGLTDENLQELANGSLIPYIVEDLELDMND